MWLEQEDKRDEAREQRCEDRDGGVISIPGQWDAMGGFKHGDEGINIHFKESS